MIVTLEPVQNSHNIWLLSQVQGENWQVMSNGGDWRNGHNIFIYFYKPILTISDTLLKLTLISHFQTAVRVELLDSGEEDSPMYRFVFPDSNALPDHPQPQVLVDEKVLVEEGGVQRECLAEVERVKQHYAAVVDQLLEERKKGYLFHNENSEGNAVEESPKDYDKSQGQTKLLEIFTGRFLFLEIMFDKSYFRMSGLKKLAYQ